MGRADGLASQQTLVVCRAYHDGIHSAEALHGRHDGHWRAGCHGNGHVWVTSRSAAAAGRRTRRERLRNAQAAMAAMPSACRPAGVRAAATR